VLLLLCELAKAFDGPSSIPSAKIRNGELVDEQNGFAVRIDSTYSWTVQTFDSGYVTKYRGVDNATGTIYFISVDVKRYPEVDQENAQKYFAGVQSGLAKTGWTIKRSSPKPSELPRKSSFQAVNYATHASGRNTTFIEHFTSPDRLFSISAAIPAGQEQENFQVLLRSFRILHADSGLGY
jgi:hypothetical protein